MNEKDINLIAEAYSKVGLVQESFNYMDLAKEILNAAEDYMVDGIRHTFAEIWSGSKEYDMILTRYVDELKELVDVAENLKKGDIEKVKRLYKGLDQGLKELLPQTFTTLASNLSLSEVPEETEE
jgi:hypothetical protein